MNSTYLIKLYIAPFIIILTQRQEHSFPHCSSHCERTFLCHAHCVPPAPANSCHHHHHCLQKIQGLTYVLGHPVCHTYSLVYVVWASLLSEHPVVMCWWEGGGLVLNVSLILYLIASDQQISIY